MEFHRHWKTRWYGPGLLAIAALCFASPWLFDRIDYELLLGNWVGYAAGAVFLLAGILLVIDNRKPYLLRIDADGVTRRHGDATLAFHWDDVVRVAIEKNADDRRNAVPRRLTIWTHSTISCPVEPEVVLDGLHGYRVALVNELAEPASEVQEALATYAGDRYQRVPTSPIPQPATTPVLSKQPVAVAGAAPEPVLLPPGDGQCRFCGSTPAVHVVFQSLWTVAVFHKVNSVRGWMCRTCGLAVYRDVMAKTLAGAWWGLGVIGLPILAVANRVKLGRVLKLAPATLTPGVAGELPGPMEAAKPVFARPAVIVASLLGLPLVAFVGWILYLGFTQP